MGKSIQCCAPFWPHVFSQRGRGALIQIKRRVRLVLVFFSNSFFLFAFAEMGSQMYKRILVAVDGSETANAALQEAVMLAKNHNSQIKLLHVVDQMMAYSVVDAPYVFEYRKAM
jgi:flavin-binding protein dodecin